MDCSVPRKVTAHCDPRSCRARLALALSDQDDFVCAPPFFLQQCAYTHDPTCSQGNAKLRCPQILENMGDIYFLVFLTPLIIKMLQLGPMLVCTCTPMIFLPLARIGVLAKNPEQRPPSSCRLLLIMQWLHSCCLVDATGFAVCETVLPSNPPYMYLSVHGTHPCTICCHLPAWPAESLGGIVEEGCGCPTMVDTATCPTLSV
jgi:hypothetical protein